MATCRSWFPYNIILLEKSRGREVRSERSPWRTSRIPGNPVLRIRSSGSLWDLQFFEFFRVSNVREITRWDSTWFPPSKLLNTHELQIRILCETCTNSALQNHIENEKIFQNPHKVYSLETQGNIPYGGFKIFFVKILKKHYNSLWAPTNLGDPEGLQRSISENLKVSGPRANLMFFKLKKPLKKH